VNICGEPENTVASRSFTALFIKIFDNIINPIYLQLNHITLINMRTLNHLTRLMLVVGITQFLSCSKSDFKSEESITGAVQSSDATVDLSGCKIRRIWTDYSGSGTPEVTGLFTYNSKGNPIKLVFNNNGTGNPDHYFFYDNLGRLKEWQETYANGTVVSLRHAYVYNSAGVIIRDTMMAIEGDTITNVSTFVYDSQGRIVKETIKNIWNSGAPLNPTRNPTFTYDVRGNLAVAGWKSSSYDNKINPLRINPIFQFIFRNWSQNNAAPQKKYNSKGLPLSINPGNDVFFNNIQTFVVVYDCQ
jgi:hypothetical protein